MWASVQRLLLGVVLIAVAAGVLLVSDLSHRKVDSGRMPQVAILQHSSQPLLDEGIVGMLDGLKEAGFEDGKSVSIRRYNAENDMPTANAIAKEISGGDFALVLTASTLSLQAVANANRDGHTIQVFGLVSDPAGAGVGISRDNPLQHPRHLVGYGTMQPVAEAFQLARRLFGGLKRVGTVWNPAEANSEAQLKVARAACQALGIELLEANVDAAAGAMEAASSLVGRDVQALWIPGDVTVLTAVDTIVAVARKGRIPVFTSIPGNAKRGTLFDVGADYHEVGRLAGALAGRILHGTDPASIAIENVMPQVLLVNRAALADLKEAWQVPDDIVPQATFVAEGSTQSVRQPAPAPAPGRVFKVGIVYFAPEPGVETCMQGLADGFRDAGFIEGKNLEVRKVHAQGEIANIPALLQNYDSQDLDLIIPMTTPCLTAAVGLVRKTAVVSTYVYDPIAAGVGESFTSHHPNVTGIGSFPPLSETVDLIQQLLPGIKTVGTLYNSSEANSRKVVSVAREIFTRRGIRLEEVTVINSSEVFQAAQALVARHAQALWISGDNTAIQGFDAIVKVANDARLPMITNDVEPVAKTSLAVVGIGFYQPGYAAAQLAAQVLRGASPKDLPFQNVATKILSLNPDVARKLGVTIPEPLLQAADSIVDASGVHQRAATATVAPTPARPLSKTWNVHILEYVNVLDVEDGEKGFRAGLHDAGLVEGRDYRLTVRNAQGDMATISGMVDAAVTDDANMLATFSTPTLQTALQRSRGVPIVFTFVADAVVAGAGRSNEDHLPNVTGVSTASAIDELLRTVRECLPSAKRIGTLFVPAEVNSVFNKDRLVEAAQKQGMEVVAVAANTSAEVSDAAAALSSQPLDAITQIAGNVTTAAFVSIAQVGQRAHIPVFGALSSNAHDGAAVVVARDYHDGGREAGLMAARIMRGEKPAQIPIRPLSTTRILLNLKAARAMGLPIPASLRERATQVIE